VQNISLNFVGAENQLHLQLLSTDENEKTILCILGSGTFSHSLDPKLTLIGGRPTGNCGTRWPLEMTVARLPLGSEFSSITAYGAGTLLPTNLAPAYNGAC
jgi:hypothetical protein